MVEALAGAPHGLGPRMRHPARRHPVVTQIWRRARARSRAGAGEREVDLDRRASLLRLFQHAVDLLDELRDDGEAERPPRAALGFHADAVVADDEDAAVAALPRFRSEERRV